MKKLISVLLAMGLVAVFSACGSTPAGSIATPDSSTTPNNSASTSSSSETTPAAGAKVTIRYADVQAENDVETLFAKKFAEIVEQKSSGRITVQVYPGGQMGEMADILSSVQMGALEMCRTNPSWLADAGAGSMNLLSLPFVFADIDHANRVLEGEVGAAMLNELTEKKLSVHGLGYLQPSGRYFFFKNKEVNSLASIKGLKIRVPTNTLSTSMVEKLGASATPISYNELYSSLQTGIVDGADNPLKGIVNMSFFEVSTHILDMSHQYEASVILTSEKFWEGLGSDDRQILDEAMDEAAAYYKQISDEALEGYKETLEQKGIKFSTPTNPQEWMDAVKPMYADFSVGYEDMLAKITAMQTK